MIARFATLYSRFSRDDRGVTLVEYGIAISLAVGIAVAVLFPVLAVEIGGAMNAAGTQMPD